MPTQSTTAARPPEITNARRTYSRATYPTCGCCGSRIVIVGMDIIKKCVCDPDDEKCPSCVKARCHCRCAEFAKRTEIEGDEPCA